MIRLASDIHLEFLEDYNIVNPNDPQYLKDQKISAYTDIIFPPLSTDSETTLVLAGDIILLRYASKYQAFFSHISSRFKNIIWVFGNHEWYKHKIKMDNIIKLKEFTDQFGNIFVLTNDHIELDDFHFIGSTLWSNIGDGSIFTTNYIVGKSVDFKFITILEKGNYSKLRPRHVINMNISSRNYILKKLIELKNDDKPKIVVTHYPPSLESVPEYYRTDPVHVGDFSIFDFETLSKENAEPMYWFHGHIHDSSNYMIGNTNVIANPRGYPEDIELNPAYNPTLIIK